MGNEFSTAAHWPDDFDEAGLQKWAESLRRQLAAPRVSLGLVFMSPRFFSRAKQVLEILRVHARIPLLAGCSSQSLIVGEHEVEQPRLQVFLRGERDRAADLATRVKFTAKPQISPMLVPKTANRRH